MLGVGTLGLLGSIGMVPGNTGPSYDPAAADFFARLTVQPSDVDKAKYNAAFLALRANGFLLGQPNALDDMCVGGPDRQSSRQNMIQNNFNALEVNAPSFVAYQGYSGDASSKYLRTGYIPSSAGGRYTQNAGHLGVYDRTTRASAAQAQLGTIGTDGVTGSAEIIVQNGSVITGQINDASTGIANSNSSGFFIADRTASNLKTIYRNGSSLGSQTTAPNGISTIEFFVLGRNFNGAISAPTADNIWGWTIGGPLGSTLAAALTTIMQNLATSFGVAV